MSKTVMIVDDMKFNIELLGRILHEEYNVIPATSGEAAIRLFKRIKPDIVLLDVFMPGIDGFGVFQYMKQRKDLANIPVIFVTGETGTEAEERGLAMGAVDYIKKPYNSTIVKVKVQNHIELKSYRDSLETLVQNRTEELEKRTRQLEERTKQLDSSREAIIMGMSLMAETHDKVTGDHIMRIKKFTGILVDKLMEEYPGIVTLEIGSQIVLFSPLHDIGKIGISDIILKKTGVLTPDEFNIMESHTVDGARLLREIELFFTVGSKVDDLHIAIEIAECHHERYDGTGYPHKLKGDDIPLSARIVSLADIYDALRSPRPYKRAFTHKEALDIILNGDGRTKRTHFDPIMLKVFASAEKEFERVYE